MFARIYLFKGWIKNKTTRERGTAIKIMHKEGPKRYDMNRQSRKLEFLIDKNITIICLSNPRGLSV